MSKEFDEFMDDVKKLAETEYPIFDGDLLGIAHNQQHSRIDFINGYNKAKEILLQLPKQEISDEEIYKASRKHITDGGGAQGWIEAAFRQGAVWYREQLRLKQEGNK